MRALLEPFKNIFEYKEDKYTIPKLGLVKDALRTIFRSIVENILSAVFKSKIVENTPSE